MPRLLSALVLCLSAGPALPQPAILEDGVLSIEHGVVREGEHSLLYKDIRLEDVGQGFEVISAQPRQLAQIETVNVVMLKSQPPQFRVQVSGLISLACLELEKPVLSRNGEVFTLYLAETPIPPNVRCAAVTEPFNLSVPLDTEGMAGGLYRVLVNGVEAEFRL